MPNRLAQESSPYLLQHANNPVDWHPWGPEAIETARRENKPIFLSIGYSACHWCHVMEHESFEDERIAQILNEHFIPVKVDREERPDLDHIYMAAVQSIAGRGGWPMSVFLTPDLEPFFGGTYWPPTARMGMPGFDQVLAAVLDAWENRREEAVEQARRLTEHLRDQLAITGRKGELSPALLEAAVSALRRSFDSRHGGFGGAPKFPHPMDLRLLLRLWRRGGSSELLQMATLTLDKMASGGIYDHLGGGFHRYSVDARWLVPHFEKMLYDNALLSLAYLEGFQATGQAEYAGVVRETLDYVLRRMTDPQGGFYSTEDADSEGEEGKFYVWTPGEIEAVLGEASAKTFCYVYDVSPEGNFEGKNILNRPKTLEQCARALGREPEDLGAELNTSRARLLAARNGRVPPGLDDKVIVAWNGLMIDAFAQAAAVLGEPLYLSAAEAAARFLIGQMRRDGRLLHSWRNGLARYSAYVDDYACLINALVSVYEASFEERWIDEAVQLSDVLLEQFGDPSGSGFFYTPADHEPLLTRHKDIQDSSVPSGNAMAATALLRLGKLSGRGDYLAAAESTLQGFAGLMGDYPTAMGQMLLALDLYLGPTPELVLLSPCDSDELAAVLADLWRRFVPRKIVAARHGEPASPSPALAGIFEGRTAVEGDLTLYVCDNFACREPVTGKEKILAAWEQLERQ